MSHVTDLSRWRLDGTLCVFSFFLLYTFIYNKCEKYENDRLRRPCFVFVSASFSKILLFSESESEIKSLDFLILD